MAQIGKTNHLVIWNEDEFKSREMETDFTKEQLFRVSRLLNGKGISVDEAFKNDTLPDNE